MVNSARPALAEIWAMLAAVPDPEIPVLSVVDLGIVRNVAYAGDTLHVTITPTYSGCPATRTIERDIASAFHARGIADLKLDVALAPAWTTDWLTPQAREKLRAYGIAPPEDDAAGPGAGAGASAVIDISRFRETRTACPRCGARDVTLVSAFGSTPCKALYRCNACREPFDHFKCH